MNFIMFQLSTQLNRGVFHFEKRIHDAKAEQDQLAEVQKGTESLQSEIKEMSDKFVILQDDLLAKDTLLERAMD